MCSRTVSPTGCRGISYPCSRSILRFLIKYRNTKQTRKDVDEANSVDFLGALVLQPSLNDILSKNITLQQKLMVCLKRIEHVFQAARSGLYAGFFFRFEIVKSLSIGSGGMILF